MKLVLCIIVGEMGSFLIYVLKTDISSPHSVKFEILRGASWLCDNEIHI